MNDRKRQQILEEVEAFTRPPRLQEDEFTVRDFAGHTQLSYSVASGRLEKQWRAGNLDRRKVLEGGHEKWAYRIADDVSE